MRLTVAEWICYFNQKIKQLEERAEAGSLLYGEDSPPQSLGMNGDLYMQFDGGFLYKKENGIWISQGKIQIDAVDGGEVFIIKREEKDYANNNSIKKGFER